MVIEKFYKECKKLVKGKLEKPPKEINADLAMPCFPLAKKLKKSPQEIAKDIAGKIKPSGLIKKIEAAGPYVNFYADWNKLGKMVIKDVKKKPKKKKEKIMIEYCQTNTHKAFHVGHVRNICLGEALSRIMEYRGYKIIRANYQGDIGPHVAKCLWGLTNLKLEPGKEKGKWLGDIYAKANSEIEGRAGLEEDVRKISNELYKGKNKGLMQLWKKTRKWSLDYFDSIYKDFSVKFDKLYFESDVFKRGIVIAKNLLKKKIAKMSEDAIIIDLKDLGVFIILKSDEDPLYSTKDLGLAELEFKEKPARVIHVVGSEQTLYFRQLFKTFEFMKKDWAEKSFHLSYGLVMLKSGKISSRAGSVVLYDELMKEGVDKARKEIKTHGLGKMENARDIAMSAIKYAMLSRDNNKSIQFDWDHVLSFEGDSGPYLQYTYARANSILEKSEKKPLLNKIDDSFIEIMKKIALFDEVTEASARDMKPHYLTNYLTELAAIFNEFYHSQRVIGDENEEALLAIVSAVKDVMEKGLTLLGIKALKKM